MPDDATPRLHAPYNFVPLAKQVCTDWGPDPSHDMPFKDGLSGTLAITVTSDTPLLVSGSDGVEETAERDGPEDNAPPKRFFRLPDRTPAIPGSSLRGMIRNVVEIIGYGKFQMVDDRHFGLRDLTAAARLDYGSQFTETVGNRVFAARSRAGWLQRRLDGRWQISPCEFARIDHGQLAHLSPQFARKLSDIKNKRKQDERTAVEIVKAWEALHGRLAPMRFAVEAEATDHRHSPGHLRYREAFEPRRAPSAVSTVEADGTLVFTGQPSKKKHLEFVFLEGDFGPALDVPPEVWGGFVDVHEHQEKPSPTWTFWRDKLAGGDVDRIPVFYLLDTRGSLRAFGLALMFKLAQDASTHDLIRGTSSDHLPAPRTDGSAPPLDLAERMFGRIDDVGAWSLKGRVDIGLARLVDTERLEEPECVTTILAAPKPGFFPAYIRQIDFADGEGAQLANRERPGRSDREVAQYRTYTPWPGGASELRGWKRYPARGAGRHAPPRLNVSQQESRGSQVRLQPLQREGGLVFDGLVHFHNLRPFELGALVWALEWGGNPDLRHGLGMGKPFGWGQVSVRIERGDRRQRVLPNLAAATVPSLESCRDTFVAAMETWALQHNIAGGWAAGLQMRRLRAMADPSNASLNEPLQYLELDPERGINRFQAAKKAGLVLREYWDRDDEQAFEEWRKGKGAMHPVAVPPISQVKGFAPDRGSATTSRTAGSQAKPVRQLLFRKNEKVLNIEENELVTVVADQASPVAPVLIRYDDGIEDEINARFLQR
ncbi:MAG: TIGR03986 family CRISPR-associated RAMP protein [Thalassobaculum sp.]|uniref:TIGR03986 family type III CRISPR-associated RAMP protein n=1 Tax=Thalassobaculum sp. TaxID=2022740 RepID=UPI0032EDEBDF